ncbi:MAG: hypothetical protein AAGH79_06705 [Bacteroidota bacterium]
MEKGGGDSSQEGKGYIGKSYRSDPPTGLATEYRYSIQKTGNNLTLELKGIPPGGDFYDLILN